MGIPVSAIAAVGALGLLLIAGRQHIVGTRRIMREAPWHIVVFSLGMYLVVYGLRNAGLTAHLAQVLDAARNTASGARRWARASSPPSCRPS